VLDLEELQLLDVVGPAGDAFHFGPCLSPDGSDIACVRVSLTQAISIICVAPVDDVGPPTDLVAGKTLDDIGPMSLSWSPGGERVHYLSSSDGEARAVDVATGEVARIATLSAKGSSGRTVPSPDGRWLLCTAWASEGDRDGVWLISAAGGHAIKLSRFYCLPTDPKAAWSPGGNHVVWAGASSSGEDCGLFVADVSNGRCQRLTGPGQHDEVARQHAWTPDDRIFLIRDRSAIIVVSRGGGTGETEIWNASAAIRYP